MTAHAPASQALPGLIYDAALDSGRWAGVLDLLREVFDARSAVLVLTDPLRRDVNLAVASGMMADPGVQEEYQRQWIDRDPALAYFSRAPVGTITTTSRLWGEPGDRGAFAFHRDFFAPLGLSDTLCVSLEQGAGRLGLLALTRAQGAPDFGDADIERLLTLTPHLQRSLQLHDQLVGQIQRGGSLSAVVERMTSGLLVLDPSGAVVAANAAARRMAARNDGISLANDRLTFPNDVRASALYRRYVQGIVTGGDDAAGERILVRRVGHGLPYGLTLVPLPPTARLLAAGERQGIILAVTEARAPSRRAVQVIADHFNLTPSECGLLAAMVDGRSVVEHAAAREVSQNAARFHAKAIFAKTHTHGRPELIRLVLLMSRTLDTLV